MRQKLTNIMAAVSLVLCVAVAVLWIRSHHTADHFFLDWRNGSSHLFRTAGGVFTLLAQRHRDVVPMERPFVELRHEGSNWVGSTDLTKEYPTSWTWAGFGFGRATPMPESIPSEPVPQRETLEATAQRLHRSVELKLRQLPRSNLTAAQMRERDALLEQFSWIHAATNPAFAEADRRSKLRTFNGLAREQVWRFEITVPAWFATLLTASLPVVKSRDIWRSRRRKRKGLCRACGYDLRATPDRCPECGFVAHSGETAAA
jgi:hypothetical protein